MIRKSLYVVMALTFCLGPFVTEKVLAQDPTPPLEPTPPAPNAAKLAQFALTPTSPYTGAQNLSVPLHAIEIDGASIPLSISYHSGGIRASENASWVGLGWALSNAGSISRTTNGLNDLSEGSSFRRDGYVYDPASIPDTLTGYVEGFGWNDPWWKGLGGSGGSGVGPYDTEPDIFSYNFMGSSGSFVLSKKSETGGVIQVIKLKENADRLEYNETDKSFTVTSSSGFKGIFSVHEYSFSVSYANNQSDWSAWQPQLIDILTPLNNGARAITGWYLSQIISPTGKTLNFNYDLNSNGYSHYISISSKTFGEKKAVDSAFPDQQQDQQSVSRVIHEHVYLSSITSDDLRLNITFNKEDREDIEKLDPNNLTFRSWLDAFGGSLERNENITFVNPPQKLTSIVVDNTDPASGFQKFITFNQSYFNGQYSNAADKEDYLRLKLEGITIDDQSYSFDYYDGLPNKSTLGVDYWGYYNGMDANQHLYPVLPNYRQFVLFSQTNLLVLSPQNFYYQSDSRKANFNFGKAGLLYQVTYPTGGKTAYQYESHDYKLEGQEEVKNTGSTSFSASGLSTNEIETFSFKGYGVDGCVGSVKVRLSVKCKDFFSGGDCELASGDATKVAVEVYRAGTTDPVFSMLYQPLWAAETSNYVSEVTLNTSANSIGFLAGDYTLKAYGVRNGTQTKYYGDVTITIPNSCRADLPSGLEDITENQVAGGARIKTITNYDKDGRQLARKKYYYASPDQGFTFSSGKLMNPLLLMQYRITSGQPLYTFTSGSQLSGSSSAQGSHIGYSFVREVTEGADGSTNGHNDYYYINRGNYYGPWSLTNAVAVPQYTASHINGELQSSSVFDEGGRSKSFTLHAPPYEQTGEIRAAKLAWQGPRPILTSFYKIRRGFTAPREIVVSEYFDGNGTTSTKVTKEWFAYNDHFLPTRKTILDGNDNILTEELTTYPVDYSDPDPVIQEMVNRNILTPVETKLFRYDGIISHLASASAVEFDIENDVVVPRSYYRLDRDEGSHDFSTDGKDFSETMEKVGVNSSFDDKGNVTETISHTGVITSYIWGYSQLYPVAKLVGVRRDQIDNVLSNDFNAGVSHLTTAQRNTLQTSFPEAQITHFKHNPGIGVTEITDPNGESIFYEYDNQGRLIYIKDTDQHIIKKVEYNYVNDLIEN